MRPNLEIAVLRSGETNLMWSNAFADVDMVLPALHGGIGEDETVQAMLDMASMAYRGMGEIGSAIAVENIC